MDEMEPTNQMPSANLLRRLEQAEQDNAQCRQIIGELNARILDLEAKLEKSVVLPEMPDGCWWERDRRRKVWRAGPSHSDSWAYCVPDTGNIVDDLSALAAKLKGEAL